jgi:5-methylcytosine-specific restriction endonuclease McrA
MKTPCHYPGCPALLNKGGYCQAHAASKPKRHTIYNKHVRSKDPALANAHKIRKSRAWERVRRLQLADHPLCADPFGMHSRCDLTETATQVHHIIGLVERPDLWNTQTNLQSLCTACHARIEREVRRNAQSDCGASSHQGEASHDTGGADEKFCPFG